MRQLLPASLRLTAVGTAEGGSRRRTAASDLQTPSSDALSRGVWGAGSAALPGGPQAAKGARPAPSGGL